MSDDVCKCGETSKDVREAGCLALMSLPTNERHDMSNELTISVLRLAATIERPKGDERIGQSLSAETWATLHEAVASLLECHDQTGIDLHLWPEVRALVEWVSGRPVDARSSADVRTGA